MALRTNLFDSTIFKVVEINNVVALRDGHILAQHELPKAKFLGGSETYIQNGEIVFLGIDGKLATRNQLADNGLRPQLKPFLVYNEELMTGPYTDLKYFAEVFETGNVAYPRALALNVGDSFTTNNYELRDGTTYVQGLYAIVPITLASPDAAKAGKLVVIKSLDIDYVGPIFAVTATTLPDGTTNAFEFTLVDLNVELEAA
jgi:hypothetical protein